MTFMPWSSELALGIDEIDRQHQELVRLTNALHDALSQPQVQRDAVGEVLEGLVEYTHNHFIVEEVLFQRYDYDESPAHQAEHNGFTAKAMDLLMRFEDGEEVSLEAMEFLKDWLIHHICKVDRAYLPFMRQALALEAQA
jgi:hemerythrin